MKKKLDAENDKRERGQDEANTVDEELAEAAKLNFDLQKEAFGRAVEKGKLENKMKQADRNMKLLNEKKKILDRQLAAARQLEDKEKAKAETELSKVNTDLNRAQKDAENAQNQLDALQQANDDIKKQGWEDKIQKLEEDVNAAEALRDQTQGEADKAAADMGAKCKVFKDPYLDRAAETDDLLNRLKGLTDSIKDKADRENDLQKRKDDLEAKRLHAQGNDDLQKDLEAACKEYDRMADDLAKQVGDIEAENEKVKTNVKDREGALKEQIGELGELSTLRDKKGDQDRELEMLDKEIEDLKVQSKRYNNDIKALQDEKEELTEQVDELDNMLQRREDENADLEADLARADR